MALFNFGKKKEEEKKAPACCCGSAKAQVAKSVECCCGTSVNGICCVKVLGAGCRACHEQYENAKTAVKALGLDVEVEYITDMEKVMGYGVMSMPALVVDDRVVSSGKVLSESEIASFLSL